MRRRWQRNGDLGFVRESELFVTGRLKDLIIVRGAKHHPEEIEATIAGSHPGFSGGGGAVFLLDEAGDPQLVALHEVGAGGAGGRDGDGACRSGRGERGARVPARHAAAAARRQPAAHHERQGAATGLGAGSLGGYEFAQNRAAHTATSPAVTATPSHPPANLSLTMPRWPMLPAFQAL